MATTLSSSFISSKISSGYSLKAVDQCTGSLTPPSLSLSLRRKEKSSVSRRTLTVQALFSDNDGGRSSSGSNFMGGFLLGGLIIGTIGFVYAPQISKTLANTDKKDLMRKLPKFIYDEEKALERQRKKLTEKIEQLNSAIDEVSNQLRTEDNPTESEANPDEVEAFA